MSINPADTATRIAQALLSRRAMIGAAVGAAVTAVVAACTGQSSSQGTASPAASPSAAGATPGLTPSAAASVPVPACVLTTGVTEGPYFVDENLDRSDIRVDPSDGTTRPGVPLKLTFNVSTVAGGSCTALAGAQVDVWHCDASGHYSDVAQNGTSGKKYLRGYQVTDANGVASFTTIYPGWYQGRAIHIHFKVRTASAARAAKQVTSQIFFDDGLSDIVMTQDAYTGRGTRDMRNGDDMIYGGNTSLLLPLVRDRAGYAGTFGVGLTSA
ncbi:MAG: hypothetical protein QOE92_2493 [Chloroflexota bacterium]|jgi:protocatechuate 3,4-dioxygenase beta subunit|nr:hypothetical protein [Chloroflexota bacterium]